MVADVMKFLVKAITGFSRGQRGIGLMEVLVAVAILGFIGASVVAALSTNYRATRITDEKVTAASLALVVGGVSITSYQMR